MIGYVHKWALWLKCGGNSGEGFGVNSDEIERTMDLEFGVMGSISKSYDQMTLGKLFSPWGLVSFSGHR